jgi:hypothetical protein
MQVEPQQIWRSDMLFNYTAFTANFKHRSGDNQGVSVVTGLLAGQTRNRGSIPGRTKGFFSPPKSPDHLLGYSPTQCEPMELLPRVKQTGCAADNSHAPLDKNERSYTSSPL